MGLLGNRDAAIVVFLATDHLNDASCTKMAALAKERETMIGALCALVGLTALSIAFLSYVLHTQLGYIFMSLQMIHDQFEHLNELEGICESCRSLEEN